jgi:hypothetical protein
VPPATKLTDELRDAIAEKVGGGSYPEVAAVACGIDRATFYRWKQRGKAGEEPYAAFCDALKKAQAEAEAVSAATIRAGQQGWQGNAWYLERRYPERWAQDRKRRALELELLRLKRDALLDLDEILSAATDDERAALREIVERVRARKARVG